MALAFNIKPVSTIKAHSTDGKSFITTHGCTTANITPAQAVAQINKILSIGGKAIVADEQMVRSQTEEVVSND